jgi:hypothetical protein
VESAGPSPKDLLPAEPAFASWILIRTLLNPLLLRSLRGDAMPPPIGVTSLTRRM